MHFSTRTERTSCPYCGEPIELVVDPSEAYQEYVEDCFVCCRPMVVTVTVEDDELQVQVRSEDQA
jgi:hypothetical protein